MPKIKRKDGKVLNIVKKTSKVKLKPLPKKLYNPRNLA